MFRTILMLLLFITCSCVWGDRGDLLNDPDDSLDWGYRDDEGRVYIHPDPDWPDIYPIIPDQAEEYEPSQ